MRIIRYIKDESKISLRVETIDDLWTLERIIFPNDLVTSKTLRKYKSNETDEGEFKEVTVQLRVEKLDLDKNAVKLRILGKIVSGHPLEYISLNSHHTLNISPGHKISIVKPVWEKYILDMLEEAVEDTKKPKLGIILVDDEKALPAKLLGYGIEFENEIRNNLSKNLSQKDFDLYQTKFFDKIIELINQMDVDVVILGGPGFTKDDIKNYIDNSPKAKSLNKKIITVNVSNTEKSGVYELIKKPEVRELLQKEVIRKEFSFMEEFLNGISLGSSVYGLDKINDAIENYAVNTILVNDDVLNDEKIKVLLDKAESYKLSIIVFNSFDEVGEQLSSFGNIGAMDYTQ